MKTKIMQAKVLADRKGLKHEDWLLLRRQGIGGSDAGAICGLNPFSTPFSVYAEKLGLTKEKEESEAMRIGNDLEEYVAQRFTESTGKRVKKCNYVLQHPKYPWMLADVDRLIVGENAGLECKTTSAFNKTDFTKADIPPQYYVQCVHYMAVTGADRWYLEVVVLGLGAYNFVIERNEEEINSLIQIEQNFWVDNVMARVEPEVDGREQTSEAIKDIYIPVEGQSVDLLPYGDLLDEYQELKSQISTLETRKEQIKQELQVYMANATEGFTGPYTVSWKEQVKNSIDTKRLKAEYPEIYNAYLKQTVTRPFRVDKKEV